MRVTLKVNVHACTIATCVSSLCMMSIVDKKVGGSKILVCVYLLLIPLLRHALIVQGC